MNKNNSTNNSANNWKRKQISQVLEIKSVMESNGSDSKDIELYIADEYKRIDKIFKLKIEKHNNENNVKNEIKKLNKWKKKELNNLIQSKIYLENNNIYNDYKYNKCYQFRYDEINNKYSDCIKKLSSNVETKHENDGVDFIDD